MTVTHIANPMQHTVVSQLTETFARIASERMRGLPVVNDALQVEAVGFRPWDGRLVGVLIAPWFMNLVVLPGRDGEWDDLADGAKVTWELPSGEYELTVARVEPVGVYQSCALFSSVLDFPDQHMARSIAETVMQELFVKQDGARGETPPQRDLPQEPLSRRRFLRGKRAR